jgi:hypothetical protein
MKKYLGYIVLVLISTLIGYWVGWSNGVNKIAISSYIANGGVEIAALHLIQEGKSDQAAALLETNLQATKVGLVGYHKLIPKKYREQYEKFLKAVQHLEASKRI